MILIRDARPEDASILAVKVKNAKRNIQQCTVKLSNEVVERVL